MQTRTLLRKILIVIAIRTFFTEALTLTKTKTKRSGKFDFLNCVRTLCIISKLRIRVNWLIQDTCRSACYEFIYILINFEIQEMNRKSISDSLLKEIRIKNVQSIKRPGLQERCYSQKMDMLRTVSKQCALRLSDVAYSQQIFLIWG